MKGVIHQAYFLPWLGFFSKLVHCDIFVVLDDVNYRHRHFQNRCKIINMNGEISYLSLPVGDKYRLKANQVQLPNDNKTINKILDTIYHSYTKATYFNNLFPEIRRILTEGFKKNKNLVEFNMYVTNEFANLISLPLPQIVYSSSIPHKGVTDEKIISICKSFNIDTLIVGAGKSIDVHNLNRFKIKKINWFVQDYLENHPEYKQVRRTRTGFVKGLSIIDVLFNVGKEKTKEYIINDIHKPFKL